MFKRNSLTLELWAVHCSIHLCCSVWHSSRVLTLKFREYFFHLLSHIFVKKIVCCVHYLCCFWVLIVACYFVNIVLIWYTDLDFHINSWWSELPWKDRDLLCSQCSIHIFCLLEGTINYHWYSDVRFFSKFLVETDDS